MNVACDYEAPMQMLTTEKYIAARVASTSSDVRRVRSRKNWTIRDFQVYICINSINRAHRRVYLPLEVMIPMFHIRVEQNVSLRGYKWIL